MPDPITPTPPPPPPPPPVLPGEDDGLAPSGDNTPKPPKPNGG